MYPKTYYTTVRPASEPGYCFVLMPFAIQFREVYDAIREVVEGDDLNFTCSRADEIFGGGHIIEDILHCIGKAEIVIADVTMRNPNVFYELGIAHMVKDMEKVLLLAQDINDVPFDLRHFRCIVYEQSRQGLRHLQGTLLASINEIARASYRFAVRTGEQYRFPQRLFGLDRCFYDFEIPDIWADREAAKFRLREFRHVIGEPVDTIRDDTFGLMCGEGIDLTRAPWRLVLEETSGGAARFRLVPRPESA